MAHSACQRRNLIDPCRARGARVRAGVPPVPGIAKGVTVFERLCGLLRVMERVCPLLSTLRRLRVKTAVLSPSRVCTGKGQFERCLQRPRACPLGFLKYWLSRLGPRRPGGGRLLGRSSRDQHRWDGKVTAREGHGEPAHLHLA